MTPILHQLTFGLMIVAAVIAAIVATERILFAGMNLRRARASILALDSDRGALEAVLGRDAVSDMVRALLANRAKPIEDKVRQDLADAAYIRTRDALFHRLWLLDTVVTAAPLLGLLGTIFGIVDTFLALSAGGNSDPTAVSSGIGTALYATALGISIALAGLVAFNYLTDRNERVCEYLKMLILKAGNA